MLRIRNEKLKKAFELDHVIFWSNLSRLNNLLVIMNISMFFLTGLVAKGYFYTFYSLIILCIVSLGLLIPTALIRSLWYYWFYFVLELLGLYFLVASVVYWVNNGNT